MNHIETERRDEGRELRIHVRGRFDFEGHREFRAAYDGVTDPRRFVVDLSRTEYLDSAGLGMLLLLREHAHHHGAEVALAGARPPVARILRIACFQELFELTSE